MKTTITVNGEVIDIEEAREELEIVDISKDMDMVASQMSYWGMIWATAESQKEQSESDYKHWLALAGEKELEEEAKLPEWKVKQRIKSDETYKKLKRVVASSIKNALLAKSMFESFKIKANMLQSKGAMLRKELDSTGMVTKEQNAIDAMKKANRKGK